MGADHTYFEGITFRNTNLAIEAGQKGIAGAVGLTVKHSTFDQVGVAIHSDWSGSKNFYIADNVHERPQRPDLSHRLVQHLAVERASTASSRSSA